jgi:E3 ubiquitin-protein ligase TRIP12
MSFGLSFTIHWIQEAQVGDLLRKRQTVQTELNTADDTRRMQELSQELSNIEDHVVRSQYWFGSLKCNLVKLDRGDDLLPISERILDIMSTRDGLQNMTEVQFIGETGFGSAVTKSFYCEICKALQERHYNRVVPMWVEDDGSSEFLQARTGLMIRPLLQNAKEMMHVCRRFRFLGRVMAMALREGYLMPLPIHEDFFRCVRGETLTAASLPRPGSGLSGEFLGVCVEFLAKIEWKRKIKDPLESSSSMACFHDYCGEAYFLETGFGGAELIPDGDNIQITSANVSEFIRVATEFWFNTGIKAQIAAFRQGLEDVLPLERLMSFSAAELRSMFCGEEKIEWDQESLLSHVHPVGGLTADSPTYKFLVKELLNMSNNHRAQFLEFVSSCPRLPPGGITNYHMDVHQEQSLSRFPRSRACANQLYLPLCRSQEDMHNMLIEAIQGSAGHHELQVNL